MSEKIKVIWSENYKKYNFGSRHPFQPLRGRLAFLRRIKQKGYETIEPERPATRAQAELVHTKDYLDSLERASQEFTTLETPVTRENVEGAYWYTSGTIMAVRLASQGTRTFDTLGGLHHAKPWHGEGFCILSDHGIAVRQLQKEGVIERAKILDIDGHAHNGTQEIFYSDPDVLTVSIHQDPDTIYPGECYPWETGEGEGKGTNMNLILDPGTTYEEYEPKLEQALEKFESFYSDVVIVVFGTDTYKKDHMTQIKLELEDYRKIGESLSNIRNLSILSPGGYSEYIPRIWLSFLEGLED